MTGRRTFVVSLRDEDGTATVHEVRTGRQASLGSLHELEEQIESWLRETTPRRAIGLSRRRDEGRLSQGKEGSGAGT
jgi:hypothetical protein